MHRPQTLAASIEPWKARLEQMAAAGDRAAQQELAGVNNPRGRPCCKPPDPDPDPGPEPEPQPDDDLVELLGQIRDQAEQLAARRERAAALTAAKRTRETTP